MKTSSGKALLSGTLPLSQKAKLKNPLNSNKNKSQNIRVL